MATKKSVTKKTKSVFLCLGFDYYDQGYVVVGKGNTKKAAIDDIKHDAHPFQVLEVEYQAPEIVEANIPFSKVAV